MRLTIGLSIKDLEHLKKFAKFIDFNEDNIKINVIKKSCTIQKMETEVARALIEKFNIDRNKTEVPPDFNKYEFNDDLMFSLIIGFIDGDGSIGRGLNGKKKRSDERYRSSARLSIKNHSSWYNNHLYMGRHIGGQVKINSQGYSRLCLSEHEILKNIKRRAISLNLPIMERKWNEIDLNVSTRVEKAKDHRNEIKMLLKQGKRNGEISKILKIAPSTVTMTIKRHKIYDTP